MNETERRKAAEDQAWDELPNESDPIEAWSEQINDAVEFGAAVRELGQVFEVLPAGVQRLWKPYLDSLASIDSDWIATRTEEILQEGESEQLADRLAQGEDDLGDQP